VRKLPRRILIGLGALLLLVMLVALVAWELLSSALEAQFLASQAQKMTWEVKPGASERIRYPGDGPYDVRLGYSKLPRHLERLQQAGWQVDAQAEVSPAMARVRDLGLFLPYHEKDQAGLTLLDSYGTPLHQRRYPQRTYARFEDIPKVLIDALLFIENRELLTEEYPTRNPAVEWDRLAQALAEKGVSLVDRKRNVPGGSTLPTQIEKYRHSPEGLTSSVSEKLRQMGTASLRAYLEGTNTLPMRRKTVMAYLNTVPLAAAPRFGEVNGVGDGLWAWYGLDFSDVNRSLKNLTADTGSDTPGNSKNDKNNKTAQDSEAAAELAQASALKHALSLIVAERRPSYYLAANRKALDALTDDHLELLAQAGVISRTLADRAKGVDLRGPRDRTDPPAPRFVEQKAANSLRIRVAALLGEARLYDLDRLDLQAETTVNQPAQQIVSRQLQSLATPSGVAAAGLFGHRMLQPGNPLKDVIYSFTLYENTPQGNLLRIQADNLNQPFDINSQARLDLGSTSKLRTLVTYLEIVARLHGEYRELDTATLRQRAQPQRDVLAQWVAAKLLARPDLRLDPLLDAAMARQYSATPETFFTGGGLHNFANFDVRDNGRVMDVWEATRNSVNLVYIRIMRDIVRHYASSTPGAAARVLDDASNPLRETYLARFVDQEGRGFIQRFYQRHRKQTPKEMADDLYTRVGANPRRFSAVFRYLEPDAGFDAYVAALHAHVPASTTLSQKTLESTYRDFGPEVYSLTDLGYLAQIHPLELWVVKSLRARPQTDLAGLYESGTGVRLEVYDWLFNTSRKNTQDIRIQSLLEVEAFDALLQDWKRLGYPFDHITPSYATAIGSSGDRPAALAELMGILVNDGVRRPTLRISGLHFAVGTPYETHLSPKPVPGERLMPVEVARTVRRALAQVVEAGTAVRVAGALKDDDGQPVLLGGKTGTGDHRFERYGKGGQLLESRVVNRTATFAFYLGDRHFGTLTALVQGEEAGDFGFTSSLTAQLLKTLLPQLQPHLDLTPRATPAAPDVPAADAAKAPTPKAPSAVREKPDGSTSQADPKVRETVPAKGGFPEDLEPSVVVPVPVTPPAPAPEPEPAPGPAPEPRSAPDAGSPAESGA
jgi:membrane peptidoglycan carboxypeptidase